MRSASTLKSHKSTKSSKSKSKTKVKTKEKSVALQNVTGLESEPSYANDGGMTPREVKRRLKEDIKKLKKKKDDYYYKITEMTTRCEAQDIDFNILRRKVNEEVKDLNKLNMEIDDEFR